MNIKIKFRHFIGSFFSENIRETIILLGKKETRKQIIKGWRYKRTIKSYTRKNCIKLSSDRYSLNTNGKIAIQIHIFYSDLLSEIYEHLKNITIEYDLYISTPNQDERNNINNFFNKNRISAQNIKIDIVDNVGRDVWPFLKQISPVYNKYDLIVHLHTKKSNDLWRKYLYNNILGTNHYADNLFSYILNNPKIGVIAPPPFPNKGVYKAYCESKSHFVAEINSLLKRLQVVVSNNNPNKMQFPAGNMFIIRPNAVKQIFLHNFTKEDFPLELGQTDHTIMHTIERVWHYLAIINGYIYKECLMK